MARVIERDQDRRAILEGARTVAVLGAHPSPSRPASYVPAYLHQQGYRVLPVNPRFVGETLWGAPVRARLDELTEQIDVVDVFRRSVDVPAHLDELLAMAPRPKVVWLQAGIRNDEVAARLVAAGIDVVQDACMYADHHRFGIPPRGVP
jgi:predicted CoA-binding protein